ncbi:MAG TPA: DUF5996 family protein [Telluria sp.]|nr:DUF5996 family protein [Telluria sp.]
MTTSTQPWPDLPFAAWQDTCATLQMWMQMVGKIRLAQTPWTNHSWHVTLYLTARGLTTSPIPYGTRVFQIDFDFIDHQLRIQTSDAMSRTMALRPRAVADFYVQLFAHLADLGLDIKIHATPNEVVDAIPFAQDRVHTAYDADYANRFWRVLVQADRVFKQFRAGYTGKSSPVHFFWGAMDLAVTRFSGRRAPPHPGGIPHCPDWVIREAYSQEVSSCGFWPGSAAMPAPVFYSYAYPAPPGFDAARVRPDEARYDTALGEFLLPYEVVRQSPSPDTVLLEFLTSTYDTAADLGKWDN